MTVRLPHPFVVAATAAVALALPAGALAGDGKPKHHHSSGCISAVCVYHEQVQTPTGPKPLASSGKTVPLSGRAARALAAKGGKDKSALRTLATAGGLGAERLVDRGTGGNSSSPSTIGAAFDLGPGPTALFALLLAAAAALALRGGLRRRQR